MKKLKKHLFILFLTVGTGYLLLWINGKDPKEYNHVVATVITIVVYVTIFIVYYIIIGEKESDEHPYHLDPYLSIVKVKNVKKDKIALVSWGYKVPENELGDLEDFFYYYFIEEIPEQLRRKGEIFKIEEDENGKQIFKKVKVDMSKRQYSIYTHIYRV